MTSSKGGESCDILPDDSQYHDEESLAPEPDSSTHFQGNIIGGNSFVQESSIKLG